MTEKMNEHGNLDWLAFQYVAGELDAAACEAFELQLLDSQAAREAVAEAVELCDAAKAASALPGKVLLPAAMPTRSSKWMSPAVWISLGAAACLFLVASLQWFSQSANPSNSAAQRPIADDSSLALAWSDLRRVQSEETNNTEESGDDQPLVDEGTLIEEIEQADSRTEFDSASWIVTALAEREGDDPVDEPAVN